MAQQYFTPPSMDWEDDSLIYTRLQKFKRDVNEVFRGPLNKCNNSVKANYLLGWIKDDVKDYLYSLHNEYDDYKDIFTALENKYQMKVNELSSFNRLRTLTQGNLTVDQFITTARKLVTECQYPNDGERLLRDIIVSGMNSKSAYIKCVDKGRELTYEEAVKIVRNEEDVRRQVEFTRPEFKNYKPTELQNSSTAVHQVEGQEEGEQSNAESVHRISYKNRSPKRYGQRQSNNSNGCQYCGYHRVHSRDQCYAKDKECSKCGKIGHFQRVCKSSRSPRKYENSRHNSRSETTRLDTIEKQLKQLTAIAHLRASPPSSPNKEFVDCIAAEFTDINYDNHKPLYKLQTSRVPTTLKDNSEQMRPMWISESPNSTIMQSTCEVDTGAGCNVISLTQAKELYKSE